jgi:hypothetical protein
MMNSVVPIFNIKMMHTEVNSLEIFKLIMYRTLLVQYINGVKYVAVGWCFPISAATK